MATLVPGGLLSWAVLQAPTGVPHVSQQLPTALSVLAAGGAAALALPRVARVPLLAASAAQYVTVCGLWLETPGRERRIERVEASTA